MRKILTCGALALSVALGSCGTTGGSVTITVNDVVAKVQAIAVKVCGFLPTASTVINIENAYLITMPQLRAALLDALRRGVKVNILTNSAESIDEPIVTAPILASLPELIAAGAGVFLKRGSTLHSKFMTVDGLFSITGSFNLHPRSVRYEHELIVSVLDVRVAARLDRAFAADVAAALSVTDPGALAIPDSPLTRIVRRYLFNQL